MTDMHNGATSAPAREGASNLTWQQLLMHESQGSKTKEKRINEKRALEKNKSNSKPKNVKPKRAEKVQESKSNMTWQQELFYHSQRPGPAFDHNADARDKETFGDEKKKGSSSTPERRKGKTKARDAKVAPPNTPLKGLTPTAAYAGPTFHNSPAAASLPAPKFSGRPKSSQAEGAAEDRSVSPAPLPQNMTEVNRLDINEPEKSDPATPAFSNATTVATSALPRTPPVPAPAPLSPSLFLSPQPNSRTYPRFPEASHPSHPNHLLQANHSAPYMAGTYLASPYPSAPSQKTSVTIPDQHTPGAPSSGHSTAPSPADAQPLPASAKAVPSSPATSSTSGFLTVDNLLSSMLNSSSLSRR